MSGLFETVGSRVLRSCEEAGQMLVLLAQNLRECRRAASSPRRMFIQMKRIGNDTLFIASAIGLFIGMVLSLHTGHALEAVEVVGFLPSIVVLSLFKEMGPVITALLLAGRVGASITAEIGTMQVNEEIDALHTLGVNPVRYLAMPRFVGCVLMLPMLVIFASIVGSFGGALISSYYFDIGLHSFFKTAFTSLDFGDVLEGQIKALAFGALVAVVACRSGFRTRGGAEGVGQSITEGVVTSFISIIICDYFITRFMM